MTSKLVILENGQIDIHNREAKFNCALIKLRKASISQHNKELIEAFINDCRLGKTIKNRAKKKLGHSRLAKLTTHLLTLAIWLNKDFDKVEQLDVEQFVLNLEANKVACRNGKPFSPETKLDYKKALRKFYKWLLGSNKIMPDLVDWIDMTPAEFKTPSLSFLEIKKLVMYASSPKLKAAILVLFDSGARIEELLNVRIKDLELRDNAYYMHIPYSKTYSRTVGLPLCREVLDEWVEIHTNTASRDSQLFPWQYNALRTLMGRLGQKVLNQNVHPHLFRHSSATYYASKLNRHQLCYRYGWSMSSKMPDRYINRLGLTEQETVEKVTGDRIKGLAQENEQLKVDLELLKEKMNNLDDVMTLILKESSIRGRTDSSKGPRSLPPIR